MHDPLFRCATLARTEIHPQNLSMAITHTGRVDNRPQATGRDWFVQHQARLLGVSVERFLRYHTVVPCRCGATDCLRWRVVYKVTGRGRGEA